MGNPIKVKFLTPHALYENANYAFDRTFIPPNFFFILYYLIFFKV